MNTSATTFLRACRARAPTSQTYLRTTHSKAIATAEPSASSLISASSRIRCRQSASSSYGAAATPLGQRSFSSNRTLHQPENVEHNAGSVSSASAAQVEGLNATILGGTTPKSSSSNSVATNSHNQESKKTSSLPPSPSPSPSYDVALLPPNLTETDLAFLTTSPSHTGTVTRINSMDKTVRVSRNILVYYAPFQKYYTRATHVLVHDAHNLLAEGDVVRYGEFPPSVRAARDARGQTVTKRSRPRDRNGVVKELGVRHMVREIVTPFGVPLDQRTSRVVGGEPGRWTGTEGQVRKIALRQNRSSSSSKGAAAKKLKAKKNKAPPVVDAQPAPEPAAAVGEQ